MARIGIDPLYEAWFRAFRRIGSHRLFRLMAERQGVDILEQCRPETEGALFRAIRNCMTCPHTEACRVWLGIMSQSDPYPDFCPNGAYWEANRPSVRAEAAHRDSPAGPAAFASPKPPI